LIGALVAAICLVPATGATAASAASGGFRVVRTGLPTHAVPAKPATATPLAATQGVWSYGPGTVAAGAQVYGWANCPAGWRAVGGGESNSSAGGVSLHSSYALDGGSGWRVEVSNDSTTDATVKVWVVCLSGLASYTQAVAKQLLGPGETGGPVARCAPGLAVLGGGGSVDTYRNAMDAYAYGPDGWRYVMQNRDSVARSANTQATCGSGVNAEGRTVDYVYVPAGGIGSSVVSCPAGTAIFSGGGGEFENLWTTDTYPEGNGWRIFVKNTDSSRSSLIRSIAICGN
jgi:hypothetical protein